MNNLTDTNYNLINKLFVDVEIHITTYKNKNGFGPMAKKERN